MKKTSNDMLKGKTIWLVEDEWVQANGLIDYLELHGAKVQYFRDPWKAREEFVRVMDSHSTPRPDVVITDWCVSSAPPPNVPSQRFRQMEEPQPESRSTFTMIEDMRKRMPDLRFVIITGEDSKNIPTLGHTQIMEKPFDYDSLMEKIATPTLGHTR